MKKIALVLFSILLMNSCSGLLWNSDSSDELTLSINNPFYQGGSASSSRALALQGEFLYIELALINDQTAYNSDGDKLLTGNGSWVNTDWGGHAIVAIDLDLNVSDVFESVFKDVPRGQDLKARVVMETDEESFLLGIDAEYGEIQPLCYTYDENAADLFEPVSGSSDRYDWMWITIPSSDLSGNVLTLPIRPESFSYYPGPFGLATQVIDSYIDTSGVSTNNSEPAVGNSKFSSFDIDLNSASNYLKDPVVYISVDSTLSINPGILALYDEEGSLLAMQSEASSNSFQTVQLALDSTYVKALFVGSTILSGTPDLTEDNSIYIGETYNVGFGILSDNSFSAENTNSDLYISLTSLPDSFQEGDIELSIINISSSGVTLPDIDTVSEVLSFSPLFDSSWDSSDFTFTGNAFTYFTTSHSPDIDSWIIILGRVPGGQSFIFGRVLVT